MSDMDNNKIKSIKTGGMEVREDGLITSTPNPSPENLAVLRAVLSRRRSARQGGMPGYGGDGEWDFVTSGLPQVTPEELNILFELAGIIPDEIESLGSCEACRHAVNGRERGYSMPCLKCLRPRHDLWESAVGRDSP